MPNSLKTRLSDLLKSSGMTANELARVSQVDYTTVYRIVNGETQNPSKKTLDPIAKALKVSTDYLHKGTGSKERQETEITLLERAMNKLESQLDKKDATIEKLTTLLLSLAGDKAVPFLTGLNYTGLLKRKSLRPQAA